MTYSIHAFTHFPEDAVRHLLLNSFSCLLYESSVRLLKFGIRWHKTPTRQLHRRICEPVTLDYVFTNAISNEIVDPQRCFHGSRRPFIVKTVLTDISCDGFQSVPPTLVGGQLGGKTFGAGAPGEVPIKVPKIPRGNFYNRYCHIQISMWLSISSFVWSTSENYATNQLFSIIDSGRSKFQAHSNLIFRGVLLEYQILLTNTLAVVRPGAMVILKRNSTGLNYRFSGRLGKTFVLFKSYQNQPGDY